jgi:AcrR family transcriptional regulator
VADRNARPSATDERKALTRDELIDAGERLCARHGVEGANLLAIAREAGQANKSAVQYYFGDRRGLIWAILDARLAWLEARRAVRLSDPDLDVRGLLEVILVPISELVDAEGRRTYARFLLQFMLQFEPWEGIRHPFLRPNADTSLDQVWRRLRPLTPHISGWILSMRLAWGLRAFLGALVEHDNALDRGRPGPPLQPLLDEAVTLCVATVMAPASSLADAKP